MKLSKKVQWMYTLVTISELLAAVHTLWWGICAVAWLDGVFRDGRTYYSAVFVAVSCFGIGIIWFWKSIHKIRFLKSCRKYFVSLQECSRVSMLEFAVMVEEDIEIARKKLLDMVSGGYIEGVTVNVHNNCITVPDYESHQVKLVPVTCAGCGGVTLIPLHSDGVCDYCGSMIKN